MDRPRCSLPDDHPTAMIQRPPEKTRSFRPAAGARKDALRRRLLFTADVLSFLLAVGAMTLVEGSTGPLWALATLPAGW